MGLLDEETGLLDEEAGLLDEEAGLLDEEAGLLLLSSFFEDELGFLLLDDAGLLELPVSIFEVASSDSDSITRSSSSVFSITSLEKGSDSVTKPSAPFLQAEAHATSKIRAQSSAIILTLDISSLRKLTGQPGPSHRRHLVYLLMQ